MVGDAEFNLSKGPTRRFHPCRVQDALSQQGLSQRGQSDFLATIIGFRPLVVLNDFFLPHSIILELINASSVDLPINPPPLNIFYYLFHYVSLLTGDNPCIINFGRNEHW